jgi:2-dehydro-3-deoxyphosphooctonate aldolase (KDO 8-P synthase)
VARANLLTTAGLWKALSGGKGLFLLAGPCVIESEKHPHFVAQRLKDITSRLGLPFVFKASYDKANRSSLGSYRGPGIDRDPSSAARRARHG